jgi:hypothetical protein
VPVNGFTLDVKQRDPGLEHLQSGLTHGCQLNFPYLCLKHKKSRGVRSGRLLSFHPWNLTGILA